MSKRQSNTLLNYFSSPKGKLTPKKEETVSSKAKPTPKKAQIASPKPKATPNKEQHASVKSENSEDITKKKLKQGNPNNK